MSVLVGALAIQFRVSFPKVRSFEEDSCAHLVSFNTKITREQTFLTVGQNNYGNKIPFLFQVMKAQLCQKKEQLPFGMIWILRIIETTPPNMEAVLFSKAPNGF